MKKMIAIMMLIFAASVFAQDEAEVVEPSVPEPVAEVIEEMPVVTEPVVEVVEETPAVPAVPIVTEVPPVPQEPAPAADAPAAPGKPRIAVYVTGAKDAVESRALGTYILEALVRSGRYIAIERTEAFLAEIDNEQVKQRSGAIDDAQISALGKQSGVDFVCVADVAKALRGNQVSVRMLNVETAEVAAMGVSDGSLKTMKDLRKMSDNVVSAMLGLGEGAVKRLSFGARVGYNHSFVNNLHYVVEGYDYETQLRNDERVDNEFGSGHGFEIGVVANIGLTKILSIETGVNFIMRKPVTVPDITEISEFALAVPALLRVNAAGSLFALAGVQFEVPFGAEETMAGQSAEDYGYRESFDAALVAGLGVNVAKGLSVDIRGVFGMMPFDSDKSNKMIQISAGLGYMF